MQIQLHHEIVDITTLTYDDTANDYYSILNLAKI